MCFVCFCVHLVHEKAVSGELGQVTMLSMCECIHLCVLALIIKCQDNIPLLHSPSTSVYTCACLCILELGQYCDASQYIMHIDSIDASILMY